MNHILFNNETKQTIELHESARLRHLYINGVNSKSKKDFLYSFIHSDIENGHGLVVFDVDGDLQEKIKKKPYKRDDIHFIDPFSDEAKINPFDIFSYGSFRSDLDEILKKDFFLQFFELAIEEELSYDGDLRYQITVILEEMFTSGETSFDSFLQLINENKYRLKLLRYWDAVHRFSSLFKLSPIDTFLPSKSSVDISRIIQDGGVVVLQMNRDIYSPKLLELTMTIFMHLVQMTLLRRLYSPLENKKPIFLYFNGLKNCFSSKPSGSMRSFYEILSEARAYKCGLVICHENMDELVFENNYLLRTSILNNCGSIFTFKPREEDADWLEKLFYDTYEDFGYKKRDIIGLKEDEYISCILSAEGVQSEPFLGKVDKI